MSHPSPQTHQQNHEAHHGHSHSHGSHPQAVGIHAVFQSITNTYYSYLHDSEIWADYMPRLPQKFYWFALAGVVLLLSPYWLSINRWLSAVLMGVGVLVLVPVVWAVFFVLRRQRLRFNFRNTILDAVPWRGDEKVLDIGCGSGVLLNGAAQRLKTGKATGIDLWAPHSGGGNLNLLMRNARAEKVADRIEFKEMDARKMSFPDASFDVVLSSGAMHHMVRGQEDFDQVTSEMIRVLKPGGQIILWDIEHMVTACAGRMNKRGLQCEVKGVEKFLKFEMGILYGKKPA